MRWILLPFVFFAAMPAHAADSAAELAAQLPRAYSGSFRWHASSELQIVTMAFDAVTERDAETVEALGSGVYDVSCTITNIKVRLEIRLPKLFVELWESGAENSDTFTTDGSHVGRLSPDLKRIDAIWTTAKDGQTGTLSLTARP